MRPLLVLAVFGVGGCANVLGLGEYGDAVDASPEDAGADVTADAVASAIDAGGDVQAKDASCATGYTCVPPLPVGWTWSAYDQGARPSCPVGFTAPTDVSEGLVAPTVCACGCTTTTPSCTTGNVRVTWGKKGGNGCQDNGDQTESATGGCQALAPSIDFNSGAKVNHGSLFRAETISSSFTLFERAPFSALGVRESAFGFGFFAGAFGSSSSKATRSGDACPGTRSSATRTAASRRAAPETPPKRAPAAPKHDRK